MTATQAVPTRAAVRLRNILFATDFSPASDVAFPYAAGLARMFGGNLSAVHVIEPANYTLPPETWQRDDEILKLEMDKLRERMIREAPHSRAEMIEREGGIWESLAETVKENEIDLIVAGTRGRTGIGKALLGSQAEELIRCATCPVLTIGPHVLAHGEPEGQFASILFATDFGADSEAAASYAAQLAREAKAKLTVLHVVKKMKSNDLAIPEQFAEADERKLRELVPDEQQFFCAPRYMVEEGTPADKILEMARRTHADLIVLGVHEATGFPGAATHLPIATIHHVVAHAPCPVLTVHR